MHIKLCMHLKTLLQENKPISYFHIPQPFRNTFVCQLPERYNLIHYLIGKEKYIQFTFGLVCLIILNAWLLFKTLNLALTNSH